MKKNKLYTVNRYNRSLFMPEKENLYSLGDFLNKAGDKLGGVMGGDQLKGSPVGGLVGGLGSAIGGTANSIISGGLSSGAGNAVAGIGSTVGGLVSNVNPVLGAAVSIGSGIIGGGINALFGESVDEEALKAANEGTAKLNSFTSNADTFDEVKGPEAVANVKDVYKGGLFNDVSDKNEELKRQRREAKMFADRSITNNVNNLISNQNSNMLRNYSAFGGPLDFGGGALGLMQQNEYFNTIDRRTDAIAGKNNTAYTGGAKTFADGGLKAAFLDSFGSDPIGAAVRYNQGLEALAAQEEAKEIEAQKAAEYADMQKRLLNLETENQGLQALMAAQPIYNESMVGMVAESEPSGTSSSTPSRATYNSNWDYIEDQLRRSGKFNDVQIEGIKYNLQRESAINPDAVGDNGAAFGLAQWHGSRKPKDMSIEGQTRHLIETLSNYDGKDHWIGKDNYDGFMNARTPEEAHYYITRGYERPAAYILNKVKRDSDMSLRNLNAFGGELGTNGTDFTNGLLYIDEGGSHEENPLEGVPMGLDPQGIPNLVEEGETVYNDYVFSDRMKVPFFMYKELGLGGVMKKKGKEMSFADASKKLAQESEQRPNDPISQAGLDASLSRLAEIQETERMRKQGKEYMGLEGYACGGKINNKYATKGKMNRNSNREYDGVHADAPATPKWDLSTDWEATTPWLFGTVEAPASEKPLTPMEQIARDKGTTVTTGGTNFAAPKETTGSGYRKKEDEEPKTYDTWMRYAPVVGAGIMSLTDALGLTNRPDYSGAASIEAAARAAGYAPNITYDPIGNYMRYSPLDRQFHTNQLLASSRATDRALANNTSPSKAAAMIANGYNTTLSLGNLARQAEEYNRAMYERTKEFNRRTNMFNSQMGLEAAMANARYQQAAKQLGLSGLAQAAALRDSIDARVGAAKSANLTNFLTSLGNIGRENFAMNQINTDRSRRYYGDLTGNVGGYKSKKKPCGKMNRK